MSHPFHKYVSHQLEAGLKKHCVLLFYDPRREFAPFIDELGALASAHDGIDQVTFGSLSASLVRYQGSFFAIRARSSPWWPWIDPSRS